MRVSGFIKNSLIDFPGIISCVIFVNGCNYNCFYCHNRSLIDENYGDINIDEIITFLKKRKGLIDGIVISGGEPTLQPDLIYHMEQFKNLGYKIKLDSNGSSPKVIDEILQNNLCDYFAIDYKAPIMRYEEICGKGANAQSVLKTISLLLSNNATFEVRTTLIPQLNESDLRLMAMELPVVPRFTLNRYRPPEKYLPSDKLRVERKPYTQSEVENFVNLIKDIQPNTIT